MFGYFEIQIFGHLVEYESVLRINKSTCSMRESMDVPQTYHRIHRFVGKHATVNMFSGKIITFAIETTTTFLSLSLFLSFSLSVSFLAIFISRSCTRVIRFVVNLNVNLIDTKSNILNRNVCFPHNSIFVFAPETFSICKHDK